MEIKNGIGVSPGVVIGTAIVLDAEDLVVQLSEPVRAALDPAVELVKSLLYELHAKQEVRT